jgi:hypothetical protein
MMVLQFSKPIYEYKRKNSFVHESEDIINGFCYFYFMTLVGNIVLLENWSTQ